MSAQIVAPEETRGVLAMDGAATVAEVAASLFVSASTVRRHLAELAERGQVTRVPGPGAPRWDVTPTGRAASDANEPL